MRRITELELKDILESHKKWLSYEADGERADLCGANLSCADLSGADLSYADLRCADLKCADLSGANLSSANLSSANLSCADLSYADLSGANLSSADLHGIQTDKNCYQVSGVGSANRLVSYFIKEDIVVCGCWECEQGNTLENFKKRVEDVYGKNGETPNELFYGEYQDVIKLFERRCNFEIY